MLIHTVTDHNFLRKHTSKFSEVSPLCRYCSLEDETAWLLLTDCPELLVERHNEPIVGENGEIDLKRVLSFVVSYLTEVLDPNGLLGAKDATINGRPTQASADNLGGRWGDGMVRLDHDGGPEVQTS